MWGGPFAQGWGLAATDSCAATGGRAPAMRVCPDPLAWGASQALLRRSGVVFVLLISHHHTCVACPAPQVPFAAFAWPEPVPVVGSVTEWSLMVDSACDDNVLLATVFVSKKAMMPYWPHLRRLMRAMSPLFGVRFAFVEVHDNYYTRCWDQDVGADVAIAKVALGGNIQNIPGERPAT